MSDAAPEPESAREKWNRRYGAQPARPHPGTPAEWLWQNMSVVVAARGRRALDVACGAGRNALFLAGLGFEVDAVDVPDVAIGRLRTAARERSLPISARRLDLEREPLPLGSHDVIVQIDYLQRDLFGPLARALAPGGSLVMETVTRAHVEQLGHRFDPRFVLERAGPRVPRTARAPLRGGHRRPLRPAAGGGEPCRAAARGPVSVRSSVAFADRVRPSAGLSTRSTNPSNGLGIRDHERSNYEGCRSSAVRRDSADDRGHAQHHLWLRGDR